MAGPYFGLQINLAMQTLGAPPGGTDHGGDTQPSIPQAKGTVPDLTVPRPPTIINIRLDPAVAGTGLVSPQAGTNPNINASAQRVIRSRQEQVNALIDELMTGGRPRAPLTDPMGGAFRITETSKAPRTMLAPLSLFGNPGAPPEGVTLPPGISDIPLMRPGAEGGMVRPQLPFENSLRPFTPASVDLPARVRFVPPDAGPRLDLRDFKRSFAGQYLPPQHPLQPNDLLTTQELVFRERLMQAKMDAAPLVGEFDHAEDARRAKAAFERVERAMGLPERPARPVTGPPVNELVPLEVAEARKAAVEAFKLSAAANSGPRIPWTILGNGLNTIGQVGLYSDLSVGVANQLADLNLRDKNYAAYKLGQSRFPTINSPGVTVTRVHPEGKPLDFVSSYSYNQQLANQQYDAIIQYRLKQANDLSQQIATVQRQVANNAAANRQLTSLQRQLDQTLVDLKTLDVVPVQINIHQEEVTFQVQSASPPQNQIQIQQQLALQAQSGASGISSATGDNDVAVTGDLKIIAGTVQAGWLECDGSAVSRTTYVDLFNVIGTTFGAGDASTTFNVPDMQGRVPVGRDPTNVRTSAPAVNIGSSGGENNHALNSAETGPHTHNIADTGHTHSAASGSFVTSAAGSEYVTSGGAKGLAAPATLQATTGITINTNGGGSAHNNMQPYVAFRYVIKT